MPIRSPKNLYPGINPHLNSFLQSDEGSWESFHAELIIQLRRFLDENLPAGYLALAEKSLQVSEIIPSGAAAFAPTQVLPLSQTVEEEELLTSIVIYQVGEEAPYGRPVTRIEVLSPANKPGGSHYSRYRVKRIETLQSGLRLVEIDYLHESRPIITTLPSYTDRENGAYPYTILVTDPRPSFEKGQIFVYGVGVLMPLPKVNIPLAGVDSTVVDFGTVYHQVYESLRLVQVVVDYSVEPVNFHRYAEADQQLIRDKMAAIL